MDTSLIILIGITLAFAVLVSGMISNVLKNRSIVYDLTSARNVGVPAYAYPEIALCRVRNQKNFERILKDKKIQKGFIYEN